MFRHFRVGVVALSLCFLLQAQEKDELLPAPVFPTISYFKERFKTPSTEVQIEPIRRLEDFVVDGKLELSLRDYLELVIANYPMVQVQKISLQIQRNGITRAFSQFDPTLTLSFSSTRASAPTTSVLQGAETLKTLNQPGRISYRQLLPTGATFQTSFNIIKRSSNDIFSTFNPAFNADLGFSFTQPLLRGRGSDITKLPIYIARARAEVSEHQFRDQLINILEQAENIYWNVVEAREFLKVQEENLKLRRAALERAQRELELGALSPLDIYQPQAEYATAEVAVTQARYQLAQAEDALRRQIGADLVPRFRNMPIELTEPVLPPTEEEKLNVEELVEAALRNRPDLLAARRNLVIDDYNIQGATNQLRPDLSLTLSYSATGRGGTFFQRSTPLLGGGSGGGIVVLPGGLGDALSQLFGFGFPTYSFTLALQLPIRDRRAAADLADALLQKKQQAYFIRNLEQNVRLEVVNAISRVESARAAVKQAIIARDLAQKRLEAEQKKYELGTTVLFFVLDAQTALLQRESEVIRQSINYRRSMASLLAVTGRLLEERGIQVQ